MNTDFASEFNKIFSNGCSISGYDWNKPRYFDSINNECYAAEVALMSSLASEAYNKFGFEVEYFIKEQDTRFDPLFGEDQLENIKRRFKLNVYAENVPQLQKQYQIQGMIFTEIITVTCTIAHFDEASKYDWTTDTELYESTVPKIGDLMYFKYSDLYYEVLNVKTHAEGTNFLSSPINYTFNLRVWRNAHENVDEKNYNDDNMEHLRSYVELGETFNVDLDLNKHAESATNVTNETPNNSVVAASGDILSNNETVDYNNLRKSKNTNSMDVLYDPNKIFEPFETLQQEVDEFGLEYTNKVKELKDVVDNFNIGTEELQQEINEIKQTTDERVEEKTKKFKDIDDELFSISANIETIQYKKVDK